MQIAWHERFSLWRQRHSFCRPYGTWIVGASVTQGCGFALPWASVVSPRWGWAVGCISMHRLFRWVRSHAIQGASRCTLRLAPLGLHYILDVFIPYEPPERDDCEGPRILDGDGESCENVDIPCVGDFQRMCGEIDNLTDVADSFKQCMRGRCGCGGSTHGRMRIRCEDEDDCGPCGGLVDQAYGCNIGGSLLWYCDPTEFPCDCVRTLFHEMSHACGALDLENGAPLDAYRIGDWFQAECWPVASSREDAHGRTAKYRRDSNGRK